MATRAPQRSPSKRESRAGVPVPNWFDLPLLLPDTDPVVGKIQRNHLETLGNGDDSSGDDRDFTALDADRSAGFVVPKVSRLSPQKQAKAIAKPRHIGEKLKREAMLQHFAQRKQQQKQRRTTTHTGAAVVLERVRHKRSTLRDRLLKDLQRFGLWHIDMVGWGDAAEQDTQASVDATVESILSKMNQQTGGNNGGSRGSGIAEEGEEEEDPQSDGREAAEHGNQAGVFLTAVPSAPERRRSIHHNQTEATIHGDGVPEEETEERDDPFDEEDDNGTGDVLSHLKKEIAAPGLQRRARLKDLHVFVEKQLQKRLFKSWESIEIALAGSGDLTVNQIVKFLQHSDVKLSAGDAAKISSILHQHVEQREAAAKQQQQQQQPEPAAVLDLPATRPQRKAAVLSFDAFKKIFQPRDTQESQRWRREFDRERIRHREEKEIYAVELAALEEKVKKRLAESAKHMVHLLDTFKLKEPAQLPWDSEAQRLSLRTDFLRVIFSKPSRRRLSQAAATIRSMAAAATMGITDAPQDGGHDALPQKLSIPHVRSALLQKYSRNGHFEAIEVPVAAFLFHDLAADAIKQSIRKLWARRAADLWPERQLIFAFRFKKQVFLAWKHFTKHAETLRAHVLRKFVAWRLHTRRRYKFYAFYRQCFWPYYVWKRHLQRMIIARGKRGFLVALVHTYTQLRNFRAWQKHHRRQQWFRRQVQRLRRRKATQSKRRLWDAWRAHLELRVRILRLWKSRGHALQRLHKHYMVRVTFFLWRYYSILRQDAMARASKCLHSQFPSVAALKQRRIEAAALPPGYRPSGSRNPGVKPPRGVSWNAPHAAAATMPNRSASMALSVSGPGHGDLEIDAVVHVEEEEEEGGDVDEPQQAEDVRQLTRIMETTLADKIQRKTRLYDLCVGLFLRFKERDRRVMTANIVRFRRVGRVFLAALKRHTLERKKHRFATDLGAFRVLSQRFRYWVSVSVYKHPLVHGDKENANPQEDDTENEPTGLELKAESIALDWKRDDEWRLRGLQSLPVEAAALSADLQAIAEDQRQRLARLHELELQLREHKRQEEIFLRKEAGATLKVRSLLMQQSQQLLRTRGHRLHDVLDRVLDSLLAQQRRAQLRSSFRAMRVALMLKLTTTLCHRAQLKNWLRLCRRFAFWQRNVGRFYELRQKFHVFRTLLRYVVYKWKHESPGLSAELQRRQRLVAKYEAYLEAHGLLTGSPSASRLALTKYSPANALLGVFLRWVQHTQLHKTHRQLVAVHRRKHQLWQLHSIFQTLRTPIKAKYTLATRQRRTPFLWRQCVADLDAMHCKMIALTHRLPTQRLRKQLRLTQRHLQKSATGAPTLKQLFQLHEQQIRHRLFLESRLMFVAYNERRVHHYAERPSSLYGAPVGRSFAYEKAPAYASISEIVLLVGKKVDAVSLVLKTNASVTVEGQLHGNPFGNREVFSLTKGEKLVSIEGYASQTIYGLRFGTSSGRVSKWFGHIEKGTKFELRAEWVGTTKREEIVGVFGFADATSIHSIGCVFRHTTLRNIFEGMWLAPSKPGDHAASDGAKSTGGDGLTLQTAQDMALCDRQFAYFLQVRMCDVLLAMKRAHRFALRVHRMAHTMPLAFTRTRVVMGLMRWYFNALAHGLVHSSDREEEGKRILQDGMNKRASGEKAVDEGTKLLAEVDSYRDEDKQLNVATLGVRKITELKEMIEQGEAKIANGKRLIEEGHGEMLHGRKILPHIPMTKRMMNAIRRMYKVVQTKDYIDQMDPELRTILLEGDGANGDTPLSIYDQV